MRRSRYVISIALLLSFIVGILFIPTAAKVRADASFSNVQLKDGVLSWDPIPDLHGDYDIDVINPEGRRTGYGTDRTYMDLFSALNHIQNSYTATYTIRLSATDRSGVNYLWTGTYDYQCVALNEVTDVSFDGKTLSWNHDSSNTPEAEISYRALVTIDGYQMIRINTTDTSIPAIDFAETGTHSYRATVSAIASGYRTGFSQTVELGYFYIEGSPSITGLSVKDGIIHWDRVEGADSYSIYAEISKGNNSGIVLDFDTSGEYYYILDDILSINAAPDQTIKVSIAAYSSDRRIAYGSSVKYHFTQQEVKTFPLSVKGKQVDSTMNLANIGYGPGRVVYYPSENKLVFVDYDLSDCPQNLDTALFRSTEPLTVEGNAVLVNKSHCLSSAGDLILAPGSDITIHSSSRGIFAQGDLYVNGKLSLDTQTNSGMCASKNIIFGKTCPSAVISTSDPDKTVEAVRSVDGTISLGHLKVIEPSGCKLNGDSNGFVNADGSVAKTVKLAVPSPTPTPKVTAKPTAKVTDKPAAKPTAKVTAKVTAKPTAKVTAKVTKAPSDPAVKPGAPTVKPASKPVVTKPVITPAADPKAKVLEFVERIYKYVLDREPEAEGASFWSDELWSFRRTGAEVGLGFIFSDEFTSRGLSDSDYVTVLYNTFFGRAPEAEGLEFWTSALSSGSMDRMDVANGFVYSQEWSDTCSSYGIRSGGIEPSVELKPGEACTSFVERMYTTAMKRKSDDEGKAFWANELANFRFTGEQVGVMFFLSDEMNGFGLSNDEFVTRLYKTFMDREPEEGGFNFWVGYLDDGGSREGAVLGFTRSEEFVNKCIEARILPY